MSQATNTAPWHNTGHTITSDRKGFQIPQELNFEIEARPIYTEQNGNFVPMAKNRVLTRTDTNQALGIIGMSYHPYTNPQMWDVVSQYCKQTGGTLDKAGQYNNGEFVWATVRHDDYEVVSGDPITKYDMFINPFTNGRTFTLINTDLRIVCGNALSSALANNDGVYRIRHSRTIADRVQIAAEASAAAVSVRSHNVEFLKALTKVRLSESQIEEFIKSMFRVTDNSNRRVLDRADTFRGLVDVGMGSDLKGVRGTAYGLYQAAIEFADHHITVRGNGDNQLNSALAGSIALFKNKAIKLIKEYVK